MEVVAIVPAADHVCTRYRLLLFRKHIEAAGLSLSIEPLERGIFHRVRQMSRNRSKQIVLLQRKLIPIWQFMLLRRRAKTILYDFDDAVFLRDSFDDSTSESTTRRQRFETIVRQSDGVIAGNSFLSKEAEKYIGRQKVDIIPTCVDSSSYSVARHDGRSVIRLVWIGSSSMLRALDKAAELFEAIGSAFPNVVLRVICDAFPTFKNLKVERRVWSAGTESADLATSDIGIAWLPDDDWNRGKCGLKVLQYMAAGLPVVASPVGVHSELMGSDSGFLCRTKDEWISRIGQLVSDRAARQQCGVAARQRVTEKFDADVWGPVLARRLRGAAHAT